MSGGHFNRVVGFTVQDSNGEEQEQYNLRIPRSEFTQLMIELIPRLFIRRFSDMPMPENCSI
jgi:hypothetical protein